MVILFMSTRPSDTEAYVPLLRAHLPDGDLRVWPDAMGDPADIEVAVIGMPESGVLAKLPNLKAVLSLWAGVDSLLADPAFPHHVPLARMVDPSLTVDMTHFVIHWVLHFHRGLHRYAAVQRDAEWTQHAYPPASSRRVGVMGLGVLGRAVAQGLSGLGFAVAGWDAIDRPLDGIETFTGEGRLTAFLGRTDILIVLLPLTDATRGLVDARALAALPEGAFLINVARGGHVVDADLIAALDSGHVEAALLDAFTVEPLPADHPFWRHPGVIVTPHVASRTRPETATAEIVADIRRLEAGEPPRHLVDVNRGY